MVKMNAENANYKEFILAARDRVDGLIYWRKHIEKALRRNGTYLGYNEVAQGVLSGRFMWFDNSDSFAIVEPCSNQSGTWFHILIAGGDYARLCNLENEIVTFAKSVNVTRLSALGRDGFLRRNKPNGWTSTRQSYFIKEF